MGRSEWHWCRSLSRRRREEEETGLVRGWPLAGSFVGGMLHDLMRFRWHLLFPSDHQHRRRRRPAHDGHPTAPTRGDSTLKVSRLETLLSETKEEEEAWIDQDDVRSFASEAPTASMNVVARLMGLGELPAPVNSSYPRRFHASAAQTTTPLRPSSSEPRHHDQKENNGRKPESRQGKNVRRGEDPPLLWRNPLSDKNYNVPLAVEGSRSLPGTPRTSFSERRSCHSETPRLSQQLDTPTMEEFDYLCEVVPESQQSPFRRPSKSSSLVTKSTNENPARAAARLPLIRDDKRCRAAGCAIGFQAVSSKQQHQKDPADAVISSGGTRSMGAHEKKKIGPSSQPTTCSELKGEHTPEDMVIEVVAVHKADRSASSPLAERGAARGKKERTLAKPVTDRFTEKPARCHRTRTAKSIITEQGKKQLPSSEPAQCPFPPPRAPALRLPAIRPPEEHHKKKLVIEQSSHSKLQGSAITDRWRSINCSHLCGLDEDHRACIHVPELRYVRLILESVGLLNRAHSGCHPAALARWHSPAHPVDPAVFNRLEQFLQSEEDDELGCLRLSCNRKLLFHVAEEVLADIIRRSLCRKHRGRSRGPAAGDMTAMAVMWKKDGGEALLRQLWSRIRRMRPAGEFRDLRDIDMMLAGVEDVVGHLDHRHRAMGRELESVAMVIGDAIFDGLVQELHH